MWVFVKILKIMDSSNRVGKLDFLFEVKIVKGVRWLINGVLFGRFERGLGGSIVIEVIYVLDCDFC